MSGADHAILDLGEDELQFTTTDYKAQTPSTASLTEFPSIGSPGTNRDDEQLVGEERGGAAGATSNFWTLAYYQQFFDVDTTDVKNRLLYSMVPLPGKSFLEHHIRPRPDLYGPFWVCVTLVFSIAISGNVADFLQKSVALDDHNWHYDFHKVSLAATAVFSYASLLPAGLYSFLWWAGGAGAAGAGISFLELICLYGYSLSIYIPVSLLWLVQVSWWQWLCVLAGAGLSGAVLFLPLWPAMRHGAARSAPLVMAVVAGLHLLLACGFMLYFFHVPPTAGPTNSTVVEPTVNSIKEGEVNSTGDKDHVKDVNKDKKSESDDGEEAETKRAIGKGESKAGNINPGEGEGDVKSVDNIEKEEKGAHAEKKPIPGEEKQIPDEENQIPDEKNTGKENGT